MVSHRPLRRILTVALLLVATLVAYGVDARIHPAHAVAAEPQPDWSKATQLDMTPDEIVLANGERYQFRAAACKENYVYNGIFGPLWRVRVLVATDFADSANLDVALLTRRYSVNDPANSPFPDVINKDDYHHLWWPAGAVKLMQKSVLASQLPMSTTQGGAVKIWDTVQLRWLLKGPHGAPPYPPYVSGSAEIEKVDFADGTETGWQRVDTWAVLATCEYEA